MSEERYIDTGRGKMAYFKTAGQAGRPTFVLLHGLSSNHLTWEEMVKALSQAGYPTIALDLRGHGHSDKARVRKNYKVSVMCDDLEQILREEKVGDFVALGYSYGGFVALELATRKPAGLKGLVLISANHVSPLAYTPLSLLSPLARAAVDLLGFALIWQSRKAYHYFDPKESVGYWRSTLSGYSTMPLSVNFWMLSEAFSLDYGEKIRSIECPTLIMRGGDDSFLSEREVRDMAGKIADSQTASIGSGHYIAAHYQELCAREIMRFIER